jgi:hypothetical protein
VRSLGFAVADGTGGEVTTNVASGAWPGWSEAGLEKTSSGVSEDALLN